jgi:serine/threonine protein kinase
MSNSTVNIFQTGYVLNDKWVIIEFIDKGAMGEVYRAHQLNLKRDVAVKVISQEMLLSFEDDPEEIEIAFQRFHREVRAMAQVRHPNVLQIFDYGSDVINKDGKDVPIEYIVMEYISGATLRFTMSEEGFYPEQDLVAAWLVDCFLPLLEGVEAIHTQDIVHRDLKPENVLMDGTTPKIADFGLACSFRMKPVTQSIDVKGTPAYMSPEHYFDFKKADRQSDIYSLGKILYESIDGKITSKTIPFKSVALSNPDTPFLQKLDQIIQEATAEEKEKRPEDVDELRKALLEAIDILKSGSGPDAVVTPGRFTFLNQPRFIWAGIAVAILSMVLMGLWHILGEPGKTTVPQKSSQVTRMESTQRTTSTPFRAESTTPAQSILGKDGITMLFVPGGEFEPGPKVLNVQRQAVQIQSFYLDEKMVTNHHFAEFLNEVKESLTIENGVVKNKSQIWFYLGKGTEQHEQIIYEHARFHLRDTEYAAHPVVRVTWYGASAYAYHYAKRIVTEYEWDYVVSKKDYRSKIFQAKKTYTLSKDAEEASVKNETYTHMMHMDAQHGSKATDVNPASKQSATDDTRANISTEKLVGQKDMIEDLNEWVMQRDTDHGNQNKAGINGNISYSSLVVGKPLRSGSETKNFRYPWEAFPDVGFRCALSL